MTRQAARDASLTHTLNMAGSRLFRPQRRVATGRAWRREVGRGDLSCPASSRFLLWLVGRPATERGSQRWRKHSTGGT